MFKDRLRLWPRCAQATSTAREKGRCPQPQSGLWTGGVLGLELTSNGHSLSVAASPSDTQPAQRTLRSPPWSREGTTEAPAGRCDTCARRAAATPRAQGSHGPRLAAKAALTAPELPARARGEPGKPGGSARPARHSQRMLRGFLCCFRKTSRGNTPLLPHPQPTLLASGRGETG